MKKLSKVLSVLLAVMLILTVLLTGCGKNASKTDGQAQNTTQGTANEPKIKLTMFMGNSGLAHPDGVDPSDNPWINIVEKYANVDLQIEVPGYQDYMTKFNLLLSSGNLPDIVHAMNARAEADKRAMEGAFIELKKYYDNSALVKKYITPEMMELAKADNGKYYAIPMAYWKGPQGTAVVARWDLVKKYNNNKWPESVDEWINVFRAEKKAEPDSIPLSNRVVGDYGLAYGGTPIYFWYGALPFGSRYEYDTGKVVANFTLPEFRAATVLMRQMYTEGILDKEFATNDVNKWSDRWANKNTIVQVNGCDQIAPHVQVNIKQGNPDPKTKDWEVLMAPMLKKWPAELKDPKYAEPFKYSPISGHGIYISSSCKYPDRAWKVIEGFACDELYEAIFWGKEGETYKVENGKRIPDSVKLADKSRYWSLHLALVFGFVDGQDVKKAIGEIGVGKQYSDLVWSSIQPINDMAIKNGLSPFDLVKLSDEAKKKLPEARQFITGATCEAIMGKITMEQFDQRVKEFQQKYGFIYDEQTKYIKDNKADMEKKGVKFNR